MRRNEIFWRQELPHVAHLVDASALVEIYHKSSILNRYLQQVSIDLTVVREVDSTLRPHRELRRERGLLDCLCIDLLVW